MSLFNEILVGFAPFTIQYWNIGTVSRIYRAANSPVFPLLIEAITRGTQTNIILSIYILTNGTFFHKMYSLTVRTDVFVMNCFQAIFQV